ncbi:MAG: M4 family metallopeptidase [Acidobacteria bacterium]|nr:M4 family metallopeptidase [Acidobacteriota bacterium]
MPRKMFRATLVGLLILSLFVFSKFSRSASSSAQIATNTSAPAVAADPAAAAVLDNLQTLTGNQIVSHVSRETGVYDFVRADGATAVLSADNPLTTPEARARGFLGQYGALVGMSDVERSLIGGQTVSGQTTASNLKLLRISTDALQNTHVKFDQTYKTLKVFGAQLVVHMNARGIVAVNGSFVPGIKLATTPKITSAQAGKTAIAKVSKTPDASLKVAKTELAVYRLGLLEGFKGRSVLAYAVEVAGPHTREQVWINAQTGNVINQISLHADALNRIVYSPTYDPAQPDSNVVKRENDPLPSAPPIENLYRFAGQAYYMYASAFGRDSYDGLGITMRTVLLANDQCPNAYWDGQATNYCPDFDKDDVVTHEWSHAYTQFTDNLIYSYQSGALNEANSDYFGETIDINNNEDGSGGSNNAQPTTYTFQNGQYAPSGGGTRWRVGEDVTGLSQPAALGILRDMWFPEAFGDPSKVSSPNYQCDSSDGGGVHTNSGVPNKAFAILVDGTSTLPGGKFNGQTVQAIGFTRAIAIYFRAKTVYQTNSTNFPQHEQALRAACNDLIGVPIKNFSTTSSIGTPSTDAITATTCQQVANATAAVEMSTPPVQCNFQKMLDPNTPAECNGSNTIFTEDWETGMDGWTLNNQGVTADWPGTNWALNSSLPANLDGSAHSGTAAFAINPKVGEPNGGTCSPGGDVSGQFWMDSPEITIPAGASDLKLSFEHFAQTEVGFDGGNVKISVNGGAFTLVPQDQYIFNNPRTALTSAAGGNTDPKAGEFAWTGANEGELSGSWGTTIINLANLTNVGDKIKIRFDFGQDGCNGNLGWFVDNVRVYACPVLEGPTLSLGSDYGNPDRDGRFTLNWVRPTGATGPDVIQESTSCGPVFSDDAQEALAAGQNSKWTGSQQWNSQPNPSDQSTAYYIPDGVLQNESLTMKNAVTIPAGATSALTFTTRQGLEDGFDFGKVEVSVDGGSFSEVASYTGPEGNIDPLTVFNGTRTIGLSQFAGHAIKLRFRVTSDAFNVGQQAGWYIDNIAITASNFQPIASGVAATSYTLTNKPDGNFCYRVATAYPVNSELTTSPFSNVVNVTVSNLVCLTNVAASSNGGKATASSTYGSRGYSPAGAIDGDRTGANWEAGGGWNDATRDLYPDSLEVAFQGSKRIHAISVYTLQDSFKSPTEPTPAMTATLYGLLDFDVQYFDGAAWQTVPGGNITGNTLVMRTLVFPDITTTKIRVVVNNAREHFSRIVEVEAIGCDPQP